MKEEEKKIWDTHHARMERVEQERQKFAQNYAQNQKALYETYGGNVPFEEKLKFANQALETMRNFSEQEQSEIKLLMNRIEEYDRSRAVNQTPQQSKFIGDLPKDKSAGKDDR